MHDVNAPPPLHERRLHACVDRLCLDNVHELFHQLWQDAPDVQDLDRIFFETAVIEVAGNILAHGVSDEPFDANVTLRVYPDRLDASLLDTAAAADVDLGRVRMPDDLQEHGRGLAIARAAVDRFVYERVDDTNCWFLSRDRTR